MPPTRCHPDVVLMDLGMPRMDGVEATRHLAATRPQPPMVIVLTMSDDDTSVVAAVRAGARGYLLKDADGDEIVAAIHAVTGGQAVFGAGVAGTVLDLLHAPPAHQEPPFEQLSHREREVLALVAADLGNQAISRRLGVSAKTSRTRFRRSLSSSVCPTEHTPQPKRVPPDSTPLPSADLIRRPAAHRECGPPRWELCPFPPGMPQRDPESATQRLLRLEQQLSRSPAVVLALGPNSRWRASCGPSLWQSDARIVMKPASA